LALIIFRKTVKGFSAIIEKALEILTNHPLCKRFNVSANESSGSFIFHHPEDSGKEAQLELLMFIALRCWNAAACSKILFSN